MATEMTRLDSDVVEKALKKKPKYLTKTGYLSQLLVWGLDHSDTLVSERERAYSYSYRDDESLREEGISTDNENWIKQQKKKPEPKDPIFEQFWRTYNSSRNKAGQSKTKAKEEWPKAIKKVDSPQKLIEAAQKAINDQSVQMEVKGESLMLPDCFRWLRDERFEALLEPVTVMQEQHSDKPLIL